VEAVRRFSLLLSCLLFLFFPLVSFGAPASKKEEEMDIFMEALSICSKEEPQRCASFIKKEKSKIKNPKLSDRLSLLYAEALFKMGNTLQLREALKEISPQNLSATEAKKLLLIKNFLLLSKDPEKALKEFIENWNSFILVIPADKIPYYVKEAVKIGNCKLSQKFTSYLLLAYPDFPLTAKSAFQTAVCFYRKKNYGKAFNLFYRIHLLYPTFKPNLVKAYLLHTSVLLKKKLKVVKDPQNFLYSLILAPPSKDVFKIYLDFLTKKFKTLNEELFSRGITAILTAKKYKVNLENYATFLYDLHVPYEFKKKNEKRIVYLFYNLKEKFKLDTKKLSTKSRSYLFASLVDFLAFEEAKRVKNSGRINYALIPNQTVTYYSFFNLPNAPKEAMNSPSLSERIKLRYLLKVKKNLKDAKKAFFSALKKGEETNFVPSYLAQFKENKIAQFYEGIEKFEPSERNYLNYILYFLSLYRLGEYSKIKKIEPLFYNLRTIADEESLKVVDYIQFATRYKNMTNLDTSAVSRWKRKIKREFQVAPR